MRISLFSLLIFAVALSASAQNAQPSNNGWARVQALPAATSIRVKAKHTVVCKFQSATDDALTCLDNGKGGVQVFPLTDIKSVTIPHRGRSASIGAAPGAALAIGAGVSKATENCTNSSQFFCGLGSDLLAAFGGVLAILGGGIGAATDFSASTLYMKP